MKKILPLLLLLFFVVVNASSQTFKWAKQAGAILDDFGYAIAVDTAGNSYVTGSFRGTITFPSGPSFTSAGGSDIFVAKYNPNGGLLWAKQAKGPSDDKGNSISIDAMGNAYVTGVIGGGTVQFALFQSITSSGGDDIFIAKYNVSGVFQWALQSGGANVDQGNGIAAHSPSGNFCVTGFFSGTAIFKSKPTGLPITLTGSGLYDYDIFIASYSPNGVLLWARKAGGIGADSGTAISVDAQNNSYTTGNFSSVFTWGGTTLTPALPIVNDGFVTQYDPLGNVQWVRTMSGPSVTEGRSISVDTAPTPTGLYVTGNYNNSLAFAGSNISISNSGNNQDMFIARYLTNGVLQWVQRAGGPGYDVVGGVSVRGAAGPYLTGLFVGTAAFGGQSLYSFGSGDIFVAQLDVSGAFLWVRQAGGVNGDFGKGIGVDGAGRAYITGGYQSDPASFPGTGCLTNPIPAFNTPTSNFFVAEIH